MHRSLHFTSENGVQNTARDSTGLAIDVCWANRSHWHEINLANVRERLQAHDARKVQRLQLQLKTASEAAVPFDC